MFVDASAIVAILTGEPEADALTDQLEATTNAITSPIAIFEAALGVRRKRRMSVAAAEEHVRSFLDVAAIDCLPVTSPDATTALDAFARYGKGSAHPAQLNLGDCFAYAMAKNRDRPVLFKGDDFNRTDLARPAADR